MLKKVSISTVLSLGLSFVASAQQPVAALKSHLAESNLLTDIVNVQGKLVAVGERGHIIYSEDGATWQQANVPVNTLLTAVDFSDKNVGFAVGHDATLLKTTDGGVNWQVVNYQPEIDKPLLNVNVIGDQVIAIGAYGLYWQSNDLGQTWKDEFHDELLIEDDRLYLQDLKEHEPEVYLEEKQFMLPHFNDVNEINEQMVMAGEAGFLAVSQDKGDTWQLVEGDYFGSYFSLLPTGEQLQVAGLRGNLFTSADKGETWSQVNTPVAATINDSFNQGDLVLHFANSGNLFYSKAGQDFKLHTFSDGKALMSGVVKDNTLYMATEAGVKSLPLSKLADK
jgi:photosystem II stability/assembly factor-like uncharacterized protein